MNHDDYASSESNSRARRMPIILGLAGVAFGALSFGFLIANAIGGDSNTPAAIDASPTAQPDGTPGDSGTPPPSKTEEPAPQPTQPTPTPVLPTATETAPAINSPKFHDIFRAEGGSVSTNTKTALPFRRADASWDNSYKNCPSAGCVRGKVSVTTGIGPLGTLESPTAAAQVFNTFVAQRSSANLLMNIKWDGGLFALATANANSSVDIEVIVRQIDPKTGKPTQAVPGMPFSVLSEELGLDVVQAIDNIVLKDSRLVNIPLKLTAGATYQIDFKVTCSTRAAFSASATTCNMTAEWTTQVVEYDAGICSPTQKGEGCIYQD